MLLPLVSHEYCVYVHMHVQVHVCFIKKIIWKHVDYMYLYHNDIKGLVL